MKNLLAIAAVLASSLLPLSSAYAADRTIKLSVPGMNCASCPYMVESAINGVNGIKSVDATMEGRTATVTFDDQITSVEEIMSATAGIGYESSLIEGDGKS